MPLVAASEHDMYEKMKAKLADQYLEAELKVKAELAYAILRLKKEKNALILGHNYMEAALYMSVPDIVGDSLELARQAQKAKESIIVFLGVHFMAETAKILNPTKKVLIPSERAGCSLAESITAEDVMRLKTRYPGAPVVTYINTSARVKAVSDICVTSGNAEHVIAKLPDEVIILIPDEYLAQNVARATGRTVHLDSLDETYRKKPISSTQHAPETLTSSANPAVADEAGTLHNDKKMLIAWPGRCEVHEQFTVEDIVSVRRQFPDAAILAHPECRPEVTAAADFSGSTRKMIEYVQHTTHARYLLLTECAMGDNVAYANPHKEMLRLCSVRCPHMATITLENTYTALKHERFEVDVPEPIRREAEKSLLRMLSF